MNVKLIELVLDGLASKIEILEMQNSKMTERIEKLEAGTVAVPKEDGKEMVLEDLLIDTKEVLEILGVSYNTLQTIVDKKLINPIRISPRRVRYSKIDVLNYINSLR